LERAPNELDLALSAQNELKVKIIGVFCLKILFIFQYQTALQERMPLWLDHKNKSHVSMDDETNEIGNMLFELGETSELLKLLSVNFFISRWNIA